MAPDAVCEWARLEKVCEFPKKLRFAEGNMAACKACKACMEMYTEGFDSDLAIIPKTKAGRYNQAGRSS
jgi:hypothetical protein